MDFIFMVFILFIVFVLILYKRKTENILTKSTLVVLLLSIITNISLSQNYTQSLIKEANDGIGISNNLANWIITDDNWGRFWSIDLFKSFYEKSTIITIIALVIFCVCLIIDTRKSNYLK